jgi:hypothetical protein
MYHGSGCLDSKSAASARVTFVSDSEIKLGRENRQPETAIGFVEERKERQCMRTSESEGELEGDEKKASPVGVRPLPLRAVQSGTAAGH